MLKFNFIKTFFCIIIQFSVTQAAAQLPQTMPAKMNLKEPLPSNLFIELGKIINPTVVNISTSVLPRNSQFQRDPMLEMLERFYNIPRQNNKKGPVQIGLGTGFIIREDGLIVTNAHVIEGADIINVQLTEKSEKLYEAKVIGSDRRTDIALIKIQSPTKLPFAILGSSKNLQVGEWVTAFGNPFGHGHTMTKGILSGKGREIGELNKIPLLQTDASINPGNSGGPLVDTQGFVIGVNSAIDARAQGIGFAIPIDEVKQIIPQLEKKGFVRRGYIGAGFADLDPQAAEYYGFPETMGAVITIIERNGAAYNAGLKPYDVIIEFNNKKIRSTVEIIDSITDSEVGKNVKLVIMRGPKKQTVNLTIAAPPEERTTQLPPKVKNPEDGMEAPYNLGFSIVDPTTKIKSDWGFPNEMKSPIIVRVINDSIAFKAGLRAGDIILDVNKINVETAKEVFQKLKANNNTLRLARSGKILILNF